MSAAMVLAWLRFQTELSENREFMYDLEHSVLIGEWSDGSPMTYTEIKDLNWSIECALWIKGATTIRPDPPDGVFDRNPPFVFRVEVLE